ncbi:dipeptide-binding ABC transporter [Vibrio sp. JCM 19236]|nr:dipeptide-binding ABC transporter [Vibrio sp. JCM 19236]
MKFNFQDEIDKKQRRASLLSNVESFKVLSEYSLQVNLKSPSNTFINNITHPSQGMISLQLLRNTVKILSHIQ